MSEEEDEMVKACLDTLQGLLTPLGGTEADRDNIVLAVDALIDAKLALMLEQLSERIEFKLGVVV